MKKLLVAMLVAALMLSGMGTAFAYSDVQGSKYEDATTTLTALGLLRGYPDGTFRPDNPITRAEFATVAVRAMGLETLAEYAQGATQFPDVAATHWASGYINIATDQGLLMGYPDGTFKPNQNVSYVEALAILVRVLGYEPVVTGSWPTNYLVKGFELGISKGVTFVAGAMATRGDVSLFTSNSLEINLMEPQFVGDLKSYIVTNKTLLDDKLGFDVVEGRIMETGAVFGTSLRSNEVVIGTDKFALAEGLDVSDWLGYRVRAWADNSTIVVASNREPDARIVTGVVGAVTLGAIDDELLRVRIGTTWYDVTANAALSRNFFLVDNDSLVAGDWVGADVELVLDGDGDAAFVKAVQFDDSMVVTDVSTRFDRVTGRDTGAAEVRLRATGDQEFHIVKDGLTVELDDIAVGDVAHFFAEGDYIYLFVIEDALSGDLEEVFVDGAKIILVVDGMEFTVAADATTSRDLDGTMWAELTEGELADFVGEFVTISLDRAGEVRHLSGDIDVAVDDTLFAIIDREPYSWGPSADGVYQFFFRARGADNKVVRYEFTKNTTWSSGTYTVDPDDGTFGVLNTDNPKGTVVQVTLAANGMVANVDRLEDMTGYAAAKTVETIHKSLQAAVIDGDTFKLDNVAIFSWDGGTDTTGVVPLEDFLDAAVGFDVDGADFDKLFLNAMLVDAADIVVTPDEPLVGVISRRSITADGVSLRILVEDATYECLIVAGTSIPEAWDGSNMGADTGESADLKVGDLVAFQCAAGEFTMITEPPATPVDGEYVYYVFSYNASTRVLRLVADPADDTHDAEWLLDVNAVIYDVTGAPVMVDDEELFDDAKVQVFVEGNIIKFVKLVK